MLYAAAAVLVLLVHLSFVLFVVFGALLMLRRPRFLWVHLPAVAWGVYIELSSRGCPLTALENLLRLRAGLADVQGSFIEYYLRWLLYPGWLTADIQYLLAALVAAVNLVLYVCVWRRRAVPVG
ncbi:DUF2784 domain-containing protein [Massilia sp. Mn16-1_5]|uniref:DUF2784 domain-containing protein n=1 Tax=Massilia sp. Mn16-1_5 TaxID=2079199 RepID=UPI00109E6B42|nr:DUF2784 domain-containing protein [Massilia sp. Mn16-1_5]THC46790.1 DUF2784 domain-containing protein [Massilia sp. Mn16-1_5]